jgi:hypothetical protein
MTSHRFDHIDAIELLIRLAGSVVLLHYAIGIYRVLYFPI